MRELTVMCMEEGLSNSMMIVQEQLYSGTVGNGDACDISGYSSYSRSTESSFSQNPKKKYRKT